MKNFLKRKFIIPTIFVVVLIFTIGFLFLFKAKVGDLRPALLPPSKNLVAEIEKQKTGAKVDLPLNIPSGFTIGVFAKDLGGAARDLQFSPNGTLLVSLPDKGKIVALPDTNNDGEADKVVELVKD